ncbi:MAG: 50S ribosomal protein L25 [Kofleriaceae bacterium]|nr:50S ribosomal protein L25 [Kofleriaceae bacterium]
MEVGKLTVQHRDKTGKGISRTTRRGGDVPGVCYGAGMETPIAISVNPKALKACLDPVKRRNTVIDVTIEKEGGSPTTFQAMVWDYQVHPLKQIITHVDLKSIDPNKKVDAEVPVKTIGIHKGMIQGGLLSWARHQVTISAKPADIPAELTLDIEDLGLGDTLHISDLKLPEGVDYSDPVKLTIVTCIAPKGLKSDGIDETEDDAPAEEGDK